MFKSKAKSALRLQLVQGACVISATIFSYWLTHFNVDESKRRLVGIRSVGFDLIKGFSSKYGQLGF